jgi:sRNA-binding protein
MAFSRTAVLLFLLPVPAAVYVATSTEDVNASGQCLPSADAVRRQYPGSWPSWTTRSVNHKGQRCWFPVMRESHAHHAETMLRRAAQRLMRREEQRESAAGNEAAGEKATVESPAAFTAEMNQFGWNFRSRSATVSPAGAAANSVEAAEDPSSFEDRFAAASNVTSVRKPSVIQRMMDPVGAVPNIP